MCVGVEFLALNVLMRTRSEQKVICNLLKSNKNWVLNMKYTFTICVGRIWISIEYFLFQKHTFNELLKVVGTKHIIGTFGEIITFVI